MPSTKRDHAALPPREHHERLRSEDGFALVVALWAIGAVALLFTTYIAAARYRVIEASATLEHAKAASMADAGVNLAILDLLTAEAAGPLAKSRQKSDGTPRLCGIGGALVAVSVGNEHGRIDLNTADPALLQSVLFLVTGDADRAKRVTASILGFRKAFGAAATASGTPVVGQSQPVRAFRSVVEAGEVPALDRATFTAVSPFLTVHSRSTGVNANLAPPQLRDMLMGGPNASKQASTASPFFVADAPGSVFRILAEAVTPTGTRFTRDAVVEIARGPPLGYAIREWRDSGVRLTTVSWSAAALPPC